MKLNEVIKAGEGIPTGLFSGAGVIFMWLLMGIMGLALVYFLFSVFDMKGANAEKRKDLKTSQRMFLGVLVVCGIATIFTCVTHENDVVKAEEFKNKVAYPYIESLPDKRSNIVSIELEENSLRTHNAFNTSVRKDMELTSIKFKDSKGFTKSLTGRVKIVDTNEKDSYLTYKRVPKYLGGNIHEGYYNVVVHMAK